MTTNTMTTTRFLIARHGESTWNAAGRWQGQADPPLSSHGEQQALSAAAELTARGPFATVVTSTLQRARRTGELLAEHCSIRMTSTVSGLVERAAGPWEGLTRSEIEERYPKWLAGRRRPVGYESDESIVARAGKALGELAEGHRGSNILVVSHGGVINALERRFGDPWRRIANLEARWFEHDGAELRPTGHRIHLLESSEVVTDPDEPYA